jgi:predicted DNA-binding transcriptional regulator AlpA
MAQQSDKIGVSEVCRMVHYSRFTIYRWVEQFKFPQPTKPPGSKQGWRWRRSEVQDWLDQREAERKRVLELAEAG